MGFGRRALAHAKTASADTISSAIPCATIQGQLIGGKSCIGKLTTDGATVISWSTGNFVAPLAAMYPPKENPANQRCGGEYVRYNPDTTANKSSHSPIP